MLVTEQWVDRIARMLKKSPEHIREINFLKEGETTHFGQVMECSQVSPPVTRLSTSGDYRQSYFQIKARQ